MSEANRRGRLRAWTLRCVIVAVVPAAAFVACTEGAGDPGRAHLAKGSPWAVTCMTQTPTAAATDGGIGSDASDGGVDGGIGPGSDGGVGSGSDGGIGPGSDGGIGSDGGMDCKGLDILESMIPLVPMGSGSAQVQSIPGFTDQLVSASITGTGFAFSTAGCSALACDFGAMPKLLPFSLAITCTATDGLSHSGLLTVQGAQGPSDTDSAILECAGSASMPLINVAPAMLDAGNVAVGTPKDLAFSVTNNGTATLTYSIELSPPLPEWTAPGSACLAPATCSVPPGGGSSVVGLRFTPATDGASTSSVAITSNAGPRTVDLAGNGVGSRIVVTDPADFDLDFGTIPRNSTATRTISVTAIGNLPVSIQASASGAPFTVAPPQLALSPGTPQDLTASCSSPTATPPTDRTIALSLAGRVRARHHRDRRALRGREHAALRRAERVRLHGAPPGHPAADAAVHDHEPRPGRGERDRGAARRRALAALARDRRRRSRACCRSAARSPASSTSRPTRTSTSRRPRRSSRSPSTASSSSTRSPARSPRPRPTSRPRSSSSAPPASARSVSGLVMMVNNGTARLRMERPEIDVSFTPRFDSPTSYPAPLLAGTSATLGVSRRRRPRARSRRTVTWAVDARRSPFVIPVSLPYIETGTAVSRREHHRPGRERRPDRATATR